jgi:hypothetical protein
MRNLNAGGSIAPFLISGLILGFFEIIPDEPAMMSLADATGFSSFFSHVPATVATSPPEVVDACVS